MKITKFDKCEKKRSEERKTCSIWHGRRLKKVFCHTKHYAHPQAIFQNNQNRYADTHTHIHTYIHTCIHAYINTRGLFGKREDKYPLETMKGKSLANRQIGKDLLSLLCNCYYTIAEENLSIGEDRTLVFCNFYFQRN